MKTSVKFINGKWTNDDVDLIPTIKLRHGSKVNNETNLKVTAISNCCQEYHGADCSHLLTLIVLV